MATATQNASRTERLLALMAKGDDLFNARDWDGVRAMLIDDGAMPILRSRLSRALWEALRARQRTIGESVDHIVRTALCEYLQVDHRTLFQISSAIALVEGIYKGEITVGTLKQHGDFGLGTFDGLDGEMIVLDGRCYQIRSDGTAREVDDAIRTPFAELPGSCPTGARSTPPAAPWPN